MTPTIAKRKCHALLGSLIPFLTHTWCEACELMLYTKLCYLKPCFDHQPQDSAFQQKPWSFASQHATQAIHAMQLMSINHTEWNPMLDTQSIYKFVLGLNETEGTLFLVPYVQYRREALTYPSISKYVWTITTYYLVLGVQPNQDISNHPNDVKTSGLQPPSSTTVFILDTSLNRLFRMG